MSISNILIFLSVIFTSISLFYPEIYTFWMNKYFLDNWKYHIYFIQFFTSNFIHWWVFHLLFNSVFVFYFWNFLEWLIWRSKFTIFFLFSIFFNWIIITIFSNNNTIWISWFALALLTYYTLELRSRKMNEYKGGITAIIVNIIIWFVPWVSFIWHVAWVIAWIIFYLINKDYFRKVMQPIKPKEEL